VTVDQCPVCEETSAQLYLDEPDPDMLPSAIGSSRAHTSPGRILRCRSCKFAFRQVRSSPEQLRDLYRQMDPTIYASELSGRDRTAQRHLQIVQRQLRPPGQLLDVGCASGLFLSHALRAGWTVTGVEPNEALSRNAQQALADQGEVQCATLETARFPVHFDAITLWDVLEHVPDPRSFLTRCCALLQPEGRLFLNVPDLDSRQARLLGKKWPLLLPEHLNYFNRESLTLCAKRAGLTPLQSGRRMAWFSLRYVGYRLAQHHVPGAEILKRSAAGSFGSILLPVSLGETFGVFRRRCSDS
jgi:SAM-dependent methyltransferase